MTKVVKIVHINECSMVEFFIKYLPSSLVVHTHHLGYDGSITYIEQISTGMTFPFCTRNEVGRINSDGFHSDEVELYDGAWFSDIKDICDKYEQYSKATVTLSVHEKQEHPC